MHGWPLAFSSSSRCWASAWRTATASQVTEPTRTLADAAGTRARGFDSMRSLRRAPVLGLGCHVVASVSRSGERQRRGVGAMNDSRMDVVVAGAGVAGLEAALALRAIAREHVTVELIAPEREFTYRPLAVAEPFDVGRMLRSPLEHLVHAAGARLRRGALTGVDSARKRGILDHREERAYDSLVLALGAHARESVPGSVTFRGTDHEPGFVTLLERASSRRLRRLAF